VHCRHAGRLRPKKKTSVTDDGTGFLRHAGQNSRPTAWVSRLPPPARRAPTDCAVLTLLLAAGSRSRPQRTSMPCPVSRSPRAFEERGGASGRSAENHALGGVHVARTPLDRLPRGVVGGAVPPFPTGGGVSHAGSRLLGRNASDSPIFANVACMPIGSHAITCAGCARSRLIGLSEVCGDTWGGG
jgi:hypothetical protein